MQIRCSCGSTDFHTFFKYKSKGVERFKCKVCNVAYESDNGNIKHFEMSEFTPTEKQVAEFNQVIEALND